MAGSSAGLLALSALVLLPAPARAWVCPEAPAQTAYTVLPDATAPAPLNTHVYVFAAAPLPEEIAADAAAWLTLRTAGGVAVPIGIHAYPALWELTPERALLPNTTYEVTIKDVAAPVGSFVTGTAADHTAPVGEAAVGGRALRILRATDAGRPAASAFLRLTTGDARDAGGAVLYEIRSRAGDGPPEAVVAADHDGLEIGWRDVCGGNWDEPGRSAGARLVVRVRSRDLAGNAGPEAEVVVDRGRPLSFYEDAVRELLLCGNVVAEAAPVVPAWPGPTKAAPTTAPAQRLALSLGRPRVVRAYRRAGNDPDCAGWVEYIELRVAARGAHATPLGFAVWTARGRDTIDLDRRPDVIAAAEGGVLRLGHARPGQEPNLFIPPERERWRLAVRAFDGAGALSPPGFVRVDLGGRRPARP